ncbi:MAG: hypothetical protein SFY81_12920 [Verrucomicrobiota bacterium]|nr:hypothetical protein [Verrucomicrobiota bacterium]
MTLLIFTRPAEELIATGFNQQRETGSIAEFDLTSSSPDYDQLLEQIFEAERIIVY